MRYFVFCVTFILLHNFACGLHRGNNVEWRERVGRVGWVGARLDSTSEGIRYIRGWWWWWWWTPHQREAGHIEDDRDDQYGHDIGPEYAVDDHTGPDVVLMMMSLTMLMPVVMMSKWEWRKEEGWSRRSWREGTPAYPASTQFTLGRSLVSHLSQIYSWTFQLFVWSDDRKHNGGSTSWHLDKDVYTSIEFHVQKNFSFQKCSPLCGPHKCPAMTCGPKALGEYTPAAVCRRGKIYIRENACVWLEGMGACCVEGGRGRLMRAEGLCPTIISATYTHIEHLSKLAGCWSNAFLVATMSIILRSKLLLRSYQCLVWCVNVEAFWLLADLRGLYSNNSDRALWGHIATGRLSTYTRCLHNLRWSDLQSSQNKIKVL